MERSLARPRKTGRYFCWDEQNIQGIPTLLVVAAMNLLVAAAFIVVARTLLRRGTSGQDALAARAFVLWWSAMAGYMALRSGLSAYAAWMEPSLAVFLVVRAISAPLLTVAVWGLVFHMVYLFTGWRGAAAPLGLLYGVLGTGFLVAAFMPMPTSVVVETWHVALQGEGESLLYRVTYAAMGATINGSALAYLSLLPKLRDTSQRMRVVLVSGSILLWTGSGLVAFMAAGDLAKFVTLVILGGLAAAAVVVAYHPPAALAAWARRADARPRRSAATDLRERVQQLV